MLHVTYAHRVKKITTKIVTTIEITISVLLFSKPVLFTSSSGVPFSVVIYDDESVDEIGAPVEIIIGASVETNVVLDVASINSVVAIGVSVDELVSVEMPIGGTSVETNVVVDVVSTNSVVTIGISVGKLISVEMSIGGASVETRLDSDVSLDDVVVSSGSKQLKIGKSIVGFK